MLQACSLVTVMFKADRSDRDYLVSNLLLCGIVL